MGDIHPAPASSRPPHDSRFGPPLGAPLDIDAAHRHPPLRSTPKSVRKRTALTFAGIWAMAGLCLLIPFANVFLSPVLFVVGAIYAYRVWRRSVLDSSANDASP